MTNYAINSYTEYADFETTADTYILKYVSHGQRMEDAKEAESIFEVLGGFEEIFEMCCLRLYVIGVVNKQAVSIMTLYLMKQNKNPLYI